MDHKPCLRQQVMSILLQLHHLHYFLYGLILILSTVLNTFHCILFQFITDHGVHRCGTLSLDIANVHDSHSSDTCREIHTRMVFGGTEVTASALDVATGHTVHAEMDFLTIPSDTEV
jgi:hypothetical protein